MNEWAMAKSNEILCPSSDTPGQETDLVLKELENIDDDTDKFEIIFVKVNDKKLAKQYGVASFPALVYFRNKAPVIYNGKFADSRTPI